MTSIGKILTNSTLLYAFPHTIGASVMTAGMLIIGISAWHIVRSSDTDIFRPALRIALPLVFVATVLTTFVGHTQAQLMTRQQPMKMAAAEALYTTQKERPVLALRRRPVRAHPKRSTLDITIPHGLSILATNTWSGRVEGINELNAQYQAKYGPGDYAPIVGLTYWTFRVMTGIGFAVAAFCALGLLLLWRGTLERPPVPARRGLGDRPAVPRERRRLDLHRDGPPAVGRAGPAQDERRRLPERPGRGRSASRSPASRCCTACSRASTGC